MIDAIPVFYREELIADAGSFSPSAGKPKAVVEAWRDARLPIDVRNVVPATIAELSVAHDAEYVAGVLACRVANGFGNCRPEVARSLPFTSGAMLCAARHALAHGVACAPVSGFHHAHYSSGEGYCTFNGLIVAAVRLLAEGQARRVMILDADVHYGNGTDDIIERLAISGQVDNVTLGRWFKTSAQAQQYLECIERESARFHEFDLVLYQAGADVHVDDPLGGVLTTEQMRVRDETVFRAAKAAGVPLAWNLAGGYQQPLSIVADLHTQTMRECVKVYVGEKRSDSSAPPGTGTSSVEVSNVSPHGFWLLIGRDELFVAFEKFPWFRDASIAQLSRVELPSSHHLRWPDLDVDLAVESIRNPEKFPLVSRPGA